MIDLNLKENLSGLCAISKSKVVGFMIFQGSVTAKDFAAFIIKILQNNAEIKNNIKNY